MAKGVSCGKFILMGEHFVISSKVPALAFPLHELWCEVKVTSHHHPKYEAKLKTDEDHEVIESLMARATYAAADSLRVDISGQPLRVESTANFPVSRGFGSSAAFAVALARAFDGYRKTLINENADWEELVKATSAVERIFHGRPSGVDASVILSGRPIRFENGAVLREIRNDAVDFVAVDSGSRDNCANLVKGVSEFRDRNGAAWDRMSDAVRGMVDECERALGAGDAVGVARAVKEAHGILTELGLSNSNIDSLIAEAQTYGALAGKVSGAGGGGAVLLIARKGDGKRLAQALRDAGRSVVATDSKGIEKRGGGSNG